MIALIILVAVCTTIALVALLIVLVDNWAGESPLYSLPQDESGAYLERDAADTVLLHLNICVESERSHVTLMAQEWQDGSLIPGEVRVFTAAPGCASYQFPGIPMPPGVAETVNDVCIPWSLSGVLGTSEGGRPLLEFRTPEVCFEDLRAAA